MTRGREPGNSRAGAGDWGPESGKAGAGKFNSLIVLENFLESRLDLVGVREVILFEDEA